MNEPPLVRQFILCDDVRSDPQNFRKINIYGVTSRLRATTGLFPYRSQQVCAYLGLTNGRGTGVGQVVIVHVETGRTVFVTTPQPFNFGQDPRAVHGAAFRMQGVTFPAPGAYAVEFRYNGVTMADETLIVEGARA